MPGIPANRTRPQSKEATVADCHFEAVLAGMLLRRGMLLTQGVLLTRGNPVMRRGDRPTGTGTHVAHCPS